MKYIALVPAALAFAIASFVSAQVYYPGDNYVVGSGAVPECVVLAGNLSYGSRSDEVRKLQRFLVSQNYPGGGSWMITGYFGDATVQAVRNFQQTAGLQITGHVDATTRAAIEARTCASASAPYGGFDSYMWGNLNLGGSLNYPYATPSYPSDYAYDYSYAPPYNYSYGESYDYSYLPTNPYPPLISSDWGFAPTIHSLSTTVGEQGTKVTVYGSNFEMSGTSVRFGVTSIVPAINATRTTFTFTVPNVPSGSYPVSVTTSRGISNSLSFNVTRGIAHCGHGHYPYSPCGQIHISSLSPTSGAAGTRVTIYGSGFSGSGNIVQFGGTSIPNLSSGGSSISFTVPHSSSGYGQQINPDAYPVSVRNAQGQISNTQTFRVTSISGGGSGAPTISNLTGPTSLSTGVQGTWTLTVNAPFGTYVTTSVRWGDEGVYGYAAGVPQSTYVSGQQTVSFTHTYQSSGVYAPVFTVTGQSGSNVASATVNVSGSGGGGAPGGLHLSSVSPNSARVGITVTLHGSGFTSVNDVHFGVGGRRGVHSSGTSISFTIPAWVSPCDLIQSGYACGAPSTQVMPGTYPIYVTNGNGATNVIDFIVTN